MTATIIDLTGRHRAAPPQDAMPSPSLRHYQDQARLAWWSQMHALIEDGVRVFDRLSAAQDELDWLARAKGLLREVEDLR